MSFFKSQVKKSYLLTKAFYRLRELYYKHYYNDIDFIKNKFKKKLNREVNLEDPQTFNEKIQWLKLNWYDKLAIKCSDKYEVRDYVRKKIGDKYLNKLYGVYDNLDELEIDSLPDKFVLKATHGSGYNIICHNKNNLNWEKAYKKMDIWMSTNYYWHTREWVYKDIKPRIISEKFIEADDAPPLKDYKFFCFNGEPKLVFVCKNRGINTTFDFYDMDWNYLNIKNHYPNSGVPIKKPKKFEKMKELAGELASEFPHVRVDFYYENNKIIFGELTFFHFSGFEPFEPEGIDKKIGSWLHLPMNNNLD